jgi:hypothetical protein
MGKARLSWPATDLPQPDEANVSDAMQAPGRIVGVLIQLLPVLVWTAWWLWAVNWRTLWPVLRGGAWAPAVLLFVMAGVVWSRIAPGPCSSLGFVVLPSPVWQLGTVAGLAALALFCGWLQGRLSWGPAEVSLEPPVADDGHGHHH